MCPLVRPRAGGTEISRDGDHHRTHSQVRPRHLPGVTRYAAVYPSLAEGRYTIWRDEHTPVATTLITGGQITSFNWPG